MGREEDSNSLKSSRLFRREASNKRSFGEAPSSVGLPVGSFGVDIEGDGFCVVGV